MSEPDEYAREMARLVWEEHGPEIEAIKEDTTHLKNVQAQHGIALSNLQAVQGQHGVTLANLQEQFNGMQGKLDEQGKMLRALLRERGIETEDS